jgi:YbgC/YbaW family acyl-CoA thioester hydrolase
MSVSGRSSKSGVQRPCSELTLRRRVQFYELDSAGIVHFSTYFRYMEEAEHALWREAGLSIAPPGAEVGFPRVSVACEYHRPLRFEDEFDVRIWIVAISEKSIRYACTLTRGVEKIATGTLTVVCVRKEAGGAMKGAAIPREIAERFAVADEAGLVP